MIKVVKKNNKEYYKSLDIIRLIVCIAVFLYHINILKGGYLAVCTFFVLSGYLSCTSALKKEKFSLKEYYLNRLLKLYLPLLTLVFMTIFVMSLFPSIKWLNIKPETISVILGYNNFWQINANLDYFARLIDSPFMHFWYMSILLQFDLIFPFIYLLFRKIGDKFNKSRVCIITCLTSIVFSIIFLAQALTTDIMVVYYSTSTRIFALLFGVSLGFIKSYYGPLILDRLKDKQKIIFYIYLLILVLLFIFVDAKSKLFPISMILTTLITLRLIDYGTIVSTEKVSVFEKPVKFLSSLSYEIYLVQYPIIFLFQTFNFVWYVSIPLIIILTLIAAYLLHICFDFKRKNKICLILKYLIRVVFLSITLFGVYKYIVTPDYTKEMKKLEEELSLNEEVMNQKREEYEEKLKQEEDTWLQELNDLEINESEIKKKIFKLPVVGIGDSVMLGASPKLYETFPNGYFDAKISRTAWKAKEILLNLKSKNMLGNPIVLNFGANGDCPLYVKKEIMKILKDHQVFWLTVTNDRDVHVNKKLFTLESQYSNLHIIDWNSISKGHSEYFVSDGIHLTEKGKKVYVNAIYDSIYQVYLEEYNSKKQEIIDKHKQDTKNKISFYGNDILFYAFDELQNTFNDSKFIIDSELTYETLKLKIENSLDDDSLTNKIVFAFDNSMDMTIEEYQTIISLCKDREIYILSMDEEIVDDLKNIHFENLTVIDFNREVSNNSNYLMFDKVHLSNIGNEALIKILKDIIET